MKNFGIFLNDLKIKLSFEENFNNINFNKKKYFGLNIEIIEYSNLYYMNGFRFLQNNSLINDFDIIYSTGNNGVKFKEGINYYFSLKKSKIVNKISIKKSSKFIQQIFFDFYGYNHPKTAVFYVLQNNFDKYLSIILENFNFPLIIKLTFSYCGNGVFLIKSKKELIENLNNNIGNCILVQEFIENEGDIRIFIIGNKICKTYGKYNKNDFRNNIDKGGKRFEFKIDDKLKKKFIEISKNYGYDIAGIDAFIFNGNYSLIEINPRPGYGNIKDGFDFNMLEEIIDLIL